MLYDVTAIATSVIVLVFVLWDGHISKLPSPTSSRAASCLARRRTS